MFAWRVLKPPAIVECVIPGTPMRLTTLDLISAIMDAPTRRLDFAIILHLAKPPDRPALEAGAISARLQYPSTAAVLDGTAWRSAPELEAGITFETVASAAANQTMTEFVNTTWDLRRTPPVRQLALSFTGAPGAALVTRFHHSACDGLGGLLWLQHELEVAAGRAPRETAAPYAPPVLRRHPSAARRSAFAFRGPADRLRADSRSASGRRSWRTVAIDMTPLQDVVARATGFTYGDLLAASALETFRLWNASRKPSREPKVGLWLPINIREQPLEGFGNGSSRVRVYRRYSPTAPLHEKSRAVRRQIEWSRERGEWAVPELRTLTRLPLVILRPLLRAYCNRPWVDMATGTFSHVERSPLDGPAFAGVTSIDFVGTLDKRHALGLFAMSRAGTTHLTFVHDPARLAEEDVSRLISIYEEQLATALVEGRS